MAPPLTVRPRRRSSPQPPSVFVAIIAPVRAAKRPDYVRGVFIHSIFRGGLRAQSWPRKRNKRRSTYQRSIERRLVELVHFIRYLHPREQLPMRQAIIEQNRTHRGFKGSAAIRFRDIEVQRLSGRLFGIILPDGTKLYHPVVRQDVSDQLDWITAEPGALLVRGASIWEGKTAAELQP